MRASLLPHAARRLQHQSLPDQRFTVGGWLQYADLDLHNPKPLLEVLVKETGEQAMITMACSYRMLGLSRLRYKYTLSGRQSGAGQEQTTDYTVQVWLQPQPGQHKPLETRRINLPASNRYQVRDYDLPLPPVQVNKAVAFGPLPANWLAVRGHILSEHSLLELTVLETGQKAQMALDIQYETPKLPYPCQPGKLHAVHTPAYTLIMKMGGVVYSRKEILLPALHECQENYVDFDIVHSERSAAWEFVPT